MFRLRNFGKIKADDKTNCTYRNLNSISQGLITDSLSGKTLIGANVIIMETWFTFLVVTSVRGDREIFYLRSFTFYYKVLEHVLFFSVGNC